MHNFNARELFRKNFKLYFKVGVLLLQTLKCTTFSNFVLIVRT